MNDIKGSSRDQIRIECLDEFVEKDSEVRVIDKIIDSLDIEAGANMNKSDIFKQYIEYFCNASQHLLNGCRIKAEDGTILYTPDGVANYNALWVRDFYYMVEYSGDLISNEDIEASITYLINGVREDGWVPDRVHDNKLAVYAAGAIETPVGRANLDNAPFLAMTVSNYLNRIDQSLAKQKFNQWFETLHKGMSIIPLSDKGLVYNDPINPHSPYGFTDTVCKTGELFKESVLYWRACKKLAQMLKYYSAKPKIEKIYSNRVLQIEKNIFSLWDYKAGAFMAASKDCRQLDNWGNAYMIYVDFPLGDYKEKIIDFFINNYNDYVWKGQVKHLPKNEVWERLLIDVKPGEYQNGAYWATASGWVLWVIAQRDIALAKNMVEDLVEYFEQVGIFECCNGNYTKINDYVVSATNPYGAIKRLST